MYDSAHVTSQNPYMKFSPLDSTPKPRQEWINACHEATEAINEAKIENLKNLLLEAVKIQMAQTCGKSFQGLNSTPDANSPNEVMSHEGRTITNIKS